MLLCAVEPRVDLGASLLIVPLATAAAFLDHRRWRGNYASSLRHPRRRTTVPDADPTRSAHPSRWRCSPGRQACGRSRAATASPVSVIQGAPSDVRRDRADDRHALPERGRDDRALHHEGRPISRANIAGEVVIGDNGSTDGSRELARKLGARRRRTSPRLRRA